MDYNLEEWRPYLRSKYEVMGTRIESFHFLIAAVKVGA